MIKSCSYRYISPKLPVLFYLEFRMKCNQVNFIKRIRTVCTVCHQMFPEKSENCMHGMFKTKTSKNKQTNKQESF